MKKYLLFILMGAGVMFISFFAHAQVVAVTVPSMPTGVNAVVGPDPGQVTITWSASTEVSGTIEGYYVYRGSGAFGNAGNTTSYVDSGLLPGVYTYSVAAYDENGNVSPSSPPFSVLVPADTTPPTAPAGVTISGATTTRTYATTTLTIAWSASTDSAGVAGYDVYQNGILIATSTGTSVTQPVNAGTYTYQIAAYDGFGNISARSAPATFTVSTDNTPPTAPTGLRIYQTSANGTMLTWNASADPAGVAGYQVFRNGSQISTTTSPTYGDSGLALETAYTYTVTAYDIPGNLSSQSAPVSVTIQPVVGPSAPIINSATLVGTSSVQIAWYVSTLDPLPITRFTLYRDGATVATVTSTSYLDTGLAPGIYAYTLTGTDASGAVSSMSPTSTVYISESSAAATSSSVATPVSTTPSIAATAPASIPGASAAEFTQSLYYGLRNVQVTSLQSLLAAKGYMSAAYATGFFGNITLQALEKFQCDRGVACTGQAGWGIVGPKTRSVLNGLVETTTSTTTSASVSTSGVAAEIQALQAELAKLEGQL